MTETTSMQLVPTLSEEELRLIDAEIAHVPYRSAVAIDALKIVQQHRGWVSDESIKAIASYLDMSADELDGIATFYNLIFRRPVGDKVILLCNSISCWIKGCDGLQQKITEQLGVQFGETTSDNRYTLLPVTCLGACDKAPVMMVGEELHEDVAESSIVRILGGSTEP
ncbi:NADH-quinone oxidoreductase subunit NuoE [Seongchinamella unica]|uniref:NADH-quinone oxidoreductase subunit E n=1 Tax=Seongchinamella unica TaxID=2547392 RepID=A0A4R5LQY0_9GAMM|nr:NADH-quinone oxidoreductase subunit NuoE [Seongchinamella unica]TDG12961.1 NADH-quinone oxidoreductase subunit NuoE [Seongchinamella unica]